MLVIYQTKNQLVLNSRTRNHNTIRQCQEVIVRQPIIGSNFKAEIFLNAVIDSFFLECHSCLPYHYENQLLSSPHIDWSIIKSILIHSKQTPGPRSDQYQHPISFHIIHTVKGHTSTDRQTQTGPRTVLANPLTGAFPFDYVNNGWISKIWGTHRVQTVNLIHL